MLALLCSRVPWYKVGFTTYLAIGGPWLGNHAPRFGVCEEVVPKGEVLVFPWHRVFCYLILGGQRFG